MRNPILVLKSLEEKASNTTYRYERLYRNLYNPEFYLLAYQNIAKSRGSMTAGADRMTLDAMSMTRINNIITSLKDHSYQPSPARREYIPKKGNSKKKRPLGIPSTDDKLVQEVVRMMLESIYEPTFSKRSHGFRPKRSCHTAMQDIQSTFTGAKWIVEGDIKACFDSFDHHIIIDILRRRIKDEYFLALMWKFLRAGYMEQWTYHKTYSGTPQGSGVSPILANIYLNELDVFMESYKSRFDTPQRHRKANKQYNAARWIYDKAKTNLRNAEHKSAVAEFKSAQKALLSTPYYPILDSNYKRIQYNRYADDFVIGVTGAKEDAEKVKADVKAFLSNTLKLTLSEEKTNITHSGELVRYLGFDFTISRSLDTKRDNTGVLRRMWYGTVRMYVPKDKWFQKLLEYKALKITRDETGRERWKALHRGNLLNKSEADIVCKYNLEIRGLYNYYRIASNVSTLDNFYNIMRRSMERTLACKHKTSTSEVRRKYTVDGIFGVYHDTKSGRKRYEFYHDGFVYQKMPMDVSSLDTLPQYRKYDKPNSLAMRLTAGVCEICAAKSGEIHMHHVKRLKDLTGKNEFELAMLQRRRRSLALCPTCYARAKKK